MVVLMLVVSGAAILARTRHFLSCVCVQGDLSIAYLLVVLRRYFRWYLQITQEHAMRLPEGLKRRKLANGLLKAKYRYALIAPYASRDPRVNAELAVWSSPFEFPRRSFLFWEIAKMLGDCARALAPRTLIFAY